MNTVTERKRLFSNVLSLLVLQGANYLLPLLTVPFLVRVLGVENFGLVAFITAVVMYFIIITDYGFNLTATRKVSLCRDNPQQLATLVSEVFWVRMLLCGLSLSVLTLLVFGIERFQAHAFAYYLAFGMVLGNALMPVWLFQGLERMAYITALNIGARCVAVAGIFLLVRQPSDYWLVLLLNAFGYLLSGMVAVYIQIFRLKIPLHRPNIHTMLMQLRDGWHVFLSSISISFYTISSSVILGFFAGNVALGYFAAAEKLIAAVKGLTAPVMQAIFPAVSRKMVENQQAAFRFVKQVGLVMLVLLGLACLLLVWFAEPIVTLVLGPNYQASILLVQLLAITPVVVLLSNIFGVQLMLPLKLNKRYSQIYVVAALLSLTLALILVPLYAELGTVLTIISIELFVMIAMGFSVWRYLRLNTSITAEQSNV